jgi:hypothetical protein
MMRSLLISLEFVPVQTEAVLKKILEVAQRGDRHGR